MSELYSNQFLLVLFGSHPKIINILKRFAIENFKETNFYFCLDLKNRTELLIQLVNQIKTDNLTVPFILEVLQNIHSKKFALTRLIKIRHPFGRDIDANGSDDIEWVTFNLVNEREKLRQLRILFGDKSIAEIFYEFTKNVQDVNLSIWCNLADCDARCRLFVKIYTMIDVSLLTNSVFLNICTDVIGKLVHAKSLSEQDFASICADYLFY